MTNQMLMATIAALLMILIFPVLFRTAQTDAPTGARNFFETILEFLRNEVFRPALKQHTDRFLPFLWTMFFFILFCNLLGLIPLGPLLGIGGSVISPETGERWSHLAGTATGTFSTTAALAICTFFMIHFSGVQQVFRDLRAGTFGHHHGPDTQMRGEALPPGALNDAHPQVHSALEQTHGQHDVGAHGVGAHDSSEAKSPAAAAVMALPLYLWNFAPHPFKPAPGASPMGWLMDVPLWGFLLILELLGAVIKPFALAIRLFANMVAGHIVLAVLISLIPVTAALSAQLMTGVPVTLLSLMIYMLELFVALLQTYIFVFLATLFISSAVAPEH